MLLGRLCGCRGGPLQQDLLQYDWPFSIHAQPASIGARTPFCRPETQKARVEHDSHDGKKVSLMEEPFDFEHFRSLLYEASRAAFPHVQRTHEGGKFYHFALSISPELGYVYPFSNTEEELTFVAQKFLAPGWHPGLSLEEAREIVRWGSDNNHLRHADAEFFEGVNEFLKPVPGILHRFPMDPWDQFRAFCDRFIGVCIDVLRQLDSEGVFGTGIRRNTAVVNIWVGDLTDERWLRYARQLNPDVVYERLERHLEFVRNLEQRLWAAKQASPPLSSEFWPNDS